MTDSPRRRSGGVKALLIPVLVLFGLAGCGDDAATTTQTTGGDDVLVEYARGGGFAPSYSHLVVQADGDATLESGYEPDDPKTKDVELTEAEVEDLTAAVEAADLDAVEVGEGICADCFTYEITTADGSIEFTDADLNEGGDAVMPVEVFDLLEQLGAIVNENGGEPSGLA